MKRRCARSASDGGDPDRVDATLDMEAFLARYAQQFNPPLRPFDLLPITVAASLDASSLVREPPSSRRDPPFHPVPRPVRTVGRPNDPVPSTIAASRVVWSRRFEVRLREEWFGLASTAGLTGIYLELPPKSKRSAVALVEVRPADGFPFEQSWRTPADGLPFESRTFELGARPTLSLMLVEVPSQARGLHVRVRFCTSTSSCDKPVQTLRVPDPRRLRPAGRSSAGHSTGGTLAPLDLGA